MIAELSENTDRDRLNSALADLSSLDRARRLSEVLTHMEFPRIHVLVNNAGIDVGHRAN